MSSASTALPVTTKIPSLDAATLRTLCLDAGADDVGFVEVVQLIPVRRELPSGRPAPNTVAIHRCGKRESLLAASVANLGSRHRRRGQRDQREIVRRLEARASRSLPAMGFPMEVRRFGTQNWIVTTRGPVAAGLGHMGSTGT